jgi:hypothetical protein
MKRLIGLKIVLVMVCLLLFPSFPSAGAKFIFQEWKAKDEEANDPNTKTNKVLKFIKNRAKFWKEQSTIKDKIFTGLMGAMEKKAAALGEKAVVDLATFANPPVGCAVKISIKALKLLVGLYILKDEEVAWGTALRMFELALKFKDRTGEIPEEFSGSSKNSPVKFSDKLPSPQKLKELGFKNESSLIKLIKDHFDGIFLKGTKSKLQIPQQEDGTVGQDTKELYAYFLVKLFLEANGYGLDTR